MQNIILNLTDSISDSTNAPKLLVGTGKEQTHLCVVMTSDRGLCGGFNSNICRLAKNYFLNILKEEKELKIITVGSKGYDQLKREYSKYIIKKLSFKDKKKISFVEADEVGKIIIELFNKNEFDKCTLFYNNFKNVITQIPQAQQIIPSEKKEVLKKNEEIFYEFEPDEDEILEELLPKNISTQVFRAFLENSASEQGSRMTAMDNATRNAGDLVNKLTIVYNRGRQASITKELIEIISGAESL
jgi:F-type H+-transporting ATPase subunit gamma